MIFGIEYSHGWRIHGGLRGLAAFLFLACFFMLAIVVPVQAADHRSWLVAAAEGTVLRYMPASTAWRHVTAGERLDPEARVRTGADGRLTIIRGRDTVEIDPNSEFTVSGDGDTDSPPDSIFQLLGRLIFEMEARQSRNFTVETPLLAATIKGTRFVVIVSPTETSVSVEEGTVEVVVRATGETALLEPGMAARVSTDGGGLQVTALETQDTTGTIDDTVDAVGDTVDGAVDGAGDAVGGAVGGTSDAVGGAAGAARGAVDRATGGLGGLR